jgi:hypothetical protein
MRLAAQARAERVALAHWVPIQGALPHALVHTLRVVAVAAFSPKPEFAARTPLTAAPAATTTRTRGLPGGPFGPHKGPAVLALGRLGVDLLLAERASAAMGQCLRRQSRAAVLTHDRFCVHICRRQVKTDQGAATEN